MTATPPKIRCFIIHLERAYQRAPQVQKLIEALPFETEVVSAIDGSLKSFVNNSFYQRSLIKPEYPFFLRPAEIATFLSHRKCWQRIVDEDVDAGLVLEDDVNIVEPDFTNSLSLALKKYQSGSIIRFPIKLREKPTSHISTEKKVRLFQPLQVGLGAQAQLISREAAKTLLSKTKIIDRPVDTYLQLVWEHHVPIFSVWPNGVCENSDNLGGSLISDKKRGWAKFKQELQRPLSRAKVKKIARKYMDRKINE